MPRLPPKHQTPHRPSRQQDRREHDRHRDSTQPYRQWYKTARWQKLRWSVLVRDMFTCQMPGCGKVETDTSQLVADHVEPHRGDPHKFWHGELRTICKPCHDSDKQAIEKGGRPRQTVGADGWPVDEPRQKGL